MHFMFLLLLAATLSFNLCKCQLDHCSKLLVMEVNASLNGTRQFSPAPRSHSHSMLSYGWALTNYTFQLLISASHDFIQAEPSPTTGTFSFHSVVSDTVGSSSLYSPRGTYGNSAHNEGSSADFEFKPHIRTSSDSGISSLGHLVTITPLVLIS